MTEQKKYSLTTKVKDLDWIVEEIAEENVLHAAYLEDDSILTVLARRTGFSFSLFDIETGFRDATGKFWLASGMKDLRNHPEFTAAEAVAWVKEQSNTVRGE